MKTHIPTIGNAGIPPIEAEPFASSSEIRVTFKDKNGLVQKQKRILLEIESNEIDIKPADLIKVFYYGIESEGKWLSF
jgi:hypothetical protein